MRNFFTHNLWWKLVSLAAAFFIWMEVASEPELATVIAVPVEYKALPKDLDISSNVIETVDIEARGPSGRLRELTDSKIAAVVDFSDVRGPGERTVTLSLAQINLPQGIALIRIIPAQLHFRFEKRMTKLLPVQVPYSGTLPSQLTIEGMEVIPPGLTIAGPKSRVEAVTRATTDPFDLTHLTGDTQQKLSVYVADPEVRFIGVPQVTVKIHVRKNR
ncbi:MAG TPA: CdaR family protein [Bryobacteraceae bacterium]|nr:CdaR family protein [Bryobacteraceae bacterium]